MGSVEGLSGALKENEDWEAVIFEMACAWARETASRFLEALDNELAGQRTPGETVDGYRTRTVLTRFGPVRARRRLYRRRGKRRGFRLDEALGWSRHRVLSPALSALAAELASRMPYRVAAETLGRLIAQSVGATTVHRTVQAIGAAESEAQAQQQRVVYEQGQAPPAGTEVADPLFVEADGLTIALQREKQRRGELKVAVCYRGAEPIGRDGKGRERRRLLGKVTTAGMEDREQFWERGWLRFGGRYDLSQTHQIVVGGDGAPWIRGGLAGTDYGLFQLDRFHLARELRRVLGGTGLVAFQALTSGQDEVARDLLANAWRAAGDDRARWEELLGLERYLSANRDGLVDWRQRVAVKSSVGLGAMESNIDKPFASRFKKRGMSWTRRGAHHLAKVLELRANGDLDAACRTLRAAADPAPPRLHPASAATTAPPRRREAPPPFQATFAPRWGPHASRPWVQALRRLIDGPTIRN
jgi:hypothetical protein